MSENSTTRPRPMTRLLIGGVDRFEAYVPEAGAVRFALDPATATCRVEAAESVPAPLDDRADQDQKETP